VTESPRARLRDLALVFLRLGTTAFGGPAAHIAMMEHEVVDRRGWMTRERFLDLLGAANLIPGPNSTELAIHIGREQAGTAGLLVAGACFIIPAVAIVMALGWAYTRFGAVPSAAAVLYGIKPLLIAIIVQAIWKLARTAIRTWELAVIGAIAAAAYALGAHELAVLVAAGLVATGSGAIRRRAIAFMPMFPVASGMSFGLAPLFLLFLKIGAVLYGSGYVLIAFLRSDFVVRLHWLTEQQLLDAVAVGQVTPGPVFTTATFVGYQLGGPVAALVATAGIFLPAFVFVAFSGPIVKLLRRSKAASGFLDGVNVASLALMGVVAVTIGRAAVVDLPTAALSIAGAIVLLKWKVNPMWLIAAGALVGVARFAIAGAL
jgi:chromate transporter